MLKRSRWNVKMSRKNSSWIFLLLLGVIVAAGATSAVAETLTWYIGSDYETEVSLEFYSENGEHVWPGGGKVYVLRKNDEYREIPLDCQAGEWICLGAWVRGDSRKYWGVGKDKRGGCDSCCSKCKTVRTTSRTLLPPNYNPATDVRAGGGYFYEMKEMK